MQRESAPKNKKGKGPARGGAAAKVGVDDLTKARFTDRELVMMTTSACLRTSFHSGNNKISRGSKGWVHSISESPRQRVICLLLVARSSENHSR